MAHADIVIPNGIIGSDRVRVFVIFVGFTISAVLFVRLLRH